MYRENYVYFIQFKKKKKTHPEIDLSEAHLILQIKTFPWNHNGVDFLNKLHKIALDVQSPQTFHTKTLVGGKNA